MKTLLMLVALCALAAGLLAEDVRVDDGFVGGITVKLSGYTMPVTPNNRQFSLASYQGITQTANINGGVSENVGGSGFSVDFLAPFTDSFTFGIGADYFSLQSSSSGTSTNTPPSSTPIDSTLYSSFSQTGFKLRASAVWYFRPFRFMSK